MEKYSWIKQENTEQGEPEAFTCIQFEQSYTVKTQEHTKTLNIKNIIALSCTIFELFEVE